MTIGGRQESMLREHSVSDARMDCNKTGMVFYIDSQGEAHEMREDAEGVSTG